MSDKRDLDFFRESDKNKKIRMRIKAINYLSVADKTNSSYTDTNGYISDNKIYGMLENIIGLHYDFEARVSIKKALKIKSALFKKTPDRMKNKYAYFPIIDNICEIEYKDNIDIKDFFIDFNSTLNYMSDGEDDRNKGGSRTNSYGATLGVRENQPYYYTGMGRRKYVEPLKDIIVDIKVSEELYKELIDIEFSSAYLGNSESVVNVYFENLSYEI